jgi:hypothetical protein
MRPTTYIPYEIWNLMPPTPPCRYRYDPHKRGSTYKAINTWRPPEKPKPPESGQG